MTLREALSLGQHYIGPEHLLLGLLGENEGVATLLGRVRQDEGVATRILVEAGANPDRIRSELIGRLPGPEPQAAEARVVRSRAGASTRRRPAFAVPPTAGAERLLMAAAARARDDGRTEFSISDVLLALTQDDQAGELLADLGIDEQAVRETGNRPEQEARADDADEQKRHRPPVKAIEAGKHRTRAVPAG